MSNTNMNMQAFMGIVHGTHPSTRRIENEYCAQTTTQSANHDAFAYVYRNGNQQYICVSSAKIRGQYNDGLHS